MGTQTSGRISKVGPLAGGGGGSMKYFLRSTGSQIRGSALQILPGVWVGFAWVWRLKVSPMWGFPKIVDPNIAP